MMSRPTTADQLDESRARALANHDHGYDAWGDLSAGVRGAFVELAEVVRRHDEAVGLVLVKRFDASNPPHPAVRDAVPLVLYFGTREDADEFKAIVMAAKPGMVAHEVGK